MGTVFGIKQIKLMTSSIAQQSEQNKLAMGTFHIKLPKIAKFLLSSPCQFGIETGRGGGVNLASPSLGS